MKQSKCIISQNLDWGAQIVVFEVEGRIPYFQRKCQTRPNSQTNRRQTKKLYSTKCISQILMRKNVYVLIFDDDE